MVRQSLLLLPLAVLIAISTVSGCFLNSCPYRRYGRNTRCNTCGPNGDGLCATESVCCTTSACFESSDCLGSVGCAARTKTCQVGIASGFCVTPILCCTQEFCQQDLRCLLN
uniref:Uncharacterized protein n=1 Tax=Panagrolaimus sp. JU765 TaxID=591449 RepID=A0AC34Q277_9BILA